MTVTNGSKKIPWLGQLISVQPRIRLSRSLSERYHSYLGYVLGVVGKCGNKKGRFLIAIGKAAHEKHRFRTGMEVSGLSIPVGTPWLETAQYYKTSKLKIEKDVTAESAVGPPFMETPPDLLTYRERGHRRLDPRTYAAKCPACIWGCQMPVEIIVDHWNPDEKKYRTETFCYGPKSCKSYRAGRVRTVPGRRGMIWEEEDWVDEDDTAHRGPDD